MRVPALLIALVACHGKSTEPPPPSPPPPTDAPAFSYTDDKDVLMFWPPTRLRLVRPSRTCDSQLSTGKDNMWTGPDVEAALRDPDVQAAVARNGDTYQPPVENASLVREATLQIGKATLAWKLHPCRWCVAEPKGIEHLRHVLEGVMSNRRSLCP